ncbi:hypothetical protein KCU59_g54, partial [Aureobasidium melanogenum]
MLASKPPIVDAVTLAAPDSHNPTSSLPTCTSVSKTAITMSSSHSSHLVAITLFNGYTTSKERSGVNEIVSPRSRVRTFSSLQSTSSMPKGMHHASSSHTLPGGTIVNQSIRTGP